MHAHRIIRAVTAALALVWVGSVAAAVTPALDAVDRVAGVVVDPAGRALERVEVFLVPVAPSGKPGATVASTSVTDELGRFVLRDVAPGLYRVAAVKEGYEVFLDRLNTRLRATLDVILHPLPRAGETGDTAVADAATWALRLPRRSVWNDTAPTAPEPVVTVVDVHARPALIPPSSLVDLIEGRVEQMFAVASPSARTWRGGLQGSDTRMRLASALGANTRVEFGGRHASMSLSGAEDDTSAPSTSGDLTAFDVGVRVLASHDDVVDVRAFWAARDFAFDPVASGPVRARHEEQVWGYDAAWTRQLDPESTLAMKFDYAAASLASPWVRAAAESGSSTNRAVGAGGTYETMPAGGHQVKVVFGARFTDLGLPTVRSVPDGTSSVRIDEAGWDLRIRAEDTWSVRGPLSLIYGLGYRHRISDDERAVVVPAIGAGWGGSDVNVRVLVSYHAESAWLADDGVDADRRPGRATRDAFGYDAAAEVAIPLGMSLRGKVSYAPIRMDAVGHGASWRPEDVGRPIYVASGDAAVHEASLSLSRDAGAARLVVGWAGGRVNGELATLLPYDLPFHALEPASLRYRTGRVGVEVPGTGTRVEFEHRRIRDRADGAGPGPLGTSAGRAQRLDEIRVVQDLARQAGASWRLLVSLQAAEMNRASVDYASRIVGERLPDSHRQVNAGVAVAF